MGYPPHNVDLVEVEEEVQSLAVSPIEEAERERHSARPWEGLEPDPTVQSQAEEWASVLPSKWMVVYCMTLCVLGTQSAACLRTRVSRSIVHRAKESSPAFARAVDEAEQIAIDGVEAALTISATVGDPEPIYQGGEYVGSKRVKNIKAAVALMEAHRPSQWRKGDTGPTVNTTIVMQSQEAVADAVRSVLPGLVRAIPGKVIEPVSEPSQE